MTALNAIARSTVLRLASPRGAAGVDLALATTSVLLVLLLVVGGLRLAAIEGDVRAAGNAAARAASQSYGEPGAAESAEDVANRMLGDRGVACRNLMVERRGTLAPGGVVAVSISCTVDLSDVVLAGFPGSITVEETGVEQVDAVRGGRPAGVEP